MTVWSDPALRPYNEFGSKAKIGESKSQYSDWRRKLGNGCYANDVDWVEWREGPRAVALIETTFYKDILEWRDKLPWYCMAALERFKRDGQYTVIQMVSQALRVPSYFVICREDLEYFFICRLSDETWRTAEEPAYRRWIMSLGYDSR